MLTRTRSAVALACTVGVLVGLAACGSSTPEAPPPVEVPPTSGSTGSSSDTTAAPGTTAARSPGTTGATTGTTSAGPPTTATSTTAGSPSTPPTSIEVSASDADAPFCNAFAASITEIESALEQAFTRTDDAQAEVELLALYKRWFQQLYDLAPPDIKGDWQVLNDIIQSTTSLEQLFSQPEEAAAEAAGDRISAWSLEHCGFDPDADGAGSMPSSSNR